MSNYTEYVFCPYCGGITAPGTCVNCGKQTIEGVTDIRTDLQNGPEIQGNISASSYIDGLQQSYGQYSQYDAQSGQKYDPNMQVGQQASVYGAQQPYENTYAAQEPPKKKRWWIWLIIITVVLFLGLVVAIVAVIAAIAVPVFLGNVNTTTQSATTSTVPAPAPIVIASEEASVSEVDEEEDSSLTHIDADEFALDVYQRSFGRYDLSYMDLQSAWDDAELYTDSTDGTNDIYLAEDYVSTFGSNHDNHSLDEFTGMYYEPFCDCIDESVDYGLTRHYMEYYDYVDNIHLNAYISYYEITGDVIPNQDALNEEIFRYTVHDLLAQLDGYTDYGWYTGSALILVDSFVTYNDGEKMSILLDVNISEDGSALAESYIYGINIDLVNGEIMENGSILVSGSEFAAIFRERCCTQNGTDIDGLNYLEDYELAAFLGDSSTNIVFYTPYGMEYGYAYELSDGSKGWMTITLADYEEYLQ